MPWNTGPTSRGILARHGVESAVTYPKAGNSTRCKGVLTRTQLRRLASATRRTAETTTRDIGNSTKAKLYDLYHEFFPARTERYRERARLQHPEFSEFGIRCIVLQRFEHDAIGIFKEMRKQNSVRRPEPKRMSPTEQMKMRTSILESGRRTHRRKFWRVVLGLRPPSLAACSRGGPPFISSASPPPHSP